MKLFDLSLLTIAIAPAAISAAPAPAAWRLATPGMPTLLIRHQSGPGPSVLFVHGATFPSALSVAYKIDGTSWMDDLRRRGFDVWAFDFAGFGGSDREEAFRNATPDAKSYGGGQFACRQIGRVVAEIRRRTGRQRIDILAHSWGTIPAGMFAAEHPELVRRLVLFGPIGPRTTGKAPAASGTAVLVGRQDQWDAFAAGRPDGEPYLAKGMFERWIRAYLASDPTNNGRRPPAVRVPSGPAADVLNARSAHYPYDVANIRVPTLLVRGEWDVNTTADDMAALAGAMTGVPGGPETATLGRGTHRMHLERNRFALFDAVGGFLSRPAEKER